VSPRSDAKSIHKSQERGIALVSVLVALVLTGTLSAMLGGAHKGRAVLRVVLGGALAMLVTYGIGQLVSPSL
jgi:vacuolar iron transporter family protein